MTAVSHEQRTAQRARAVESAAAERRDPRRRRWGRVAAGLAAVLVGGWLFASLYVSADDRREVVGLAADVAQWDAIERSDLRVFRLPFDAGLASVSASRIEELVGRVAAADLVAGSLLVEAELFPAGEQLLTFDEAVVGILVGPGDAPVASITRGAPVAVVIRPAVGTSEVVDEVSGRVADVSKSVASNGERPVEVIVPRVAAARVSAAAAERRVTIVVLGA